MISSGRDRDADVVVVGYGPVGMATAALLGRAGHRVLVLERYAGLYNLPRAAIFDDETTRTLARLGVTDELMPRVHAQRTYEWRNAAGELLLEHDFAAVGRSGWAEWSMMYQPDLESALDRAVRDAGVEVRHCHPVTAIADRGDHVELTVAGPDGPGTVRARWVVACDGGNSFVREALAVPQEDFGFSEPWMVCDFRFHSPGGRPASLPLALQLGDPAGPTSVISLGPDHHRISFMLDSAEDFATESAPDRVWARAARWITPDDAELIRVATYTFRSLVARDWRLGRVLLAGDAAHQMPPFLGQGMCSGIRDAANIAFKLDGVLAGRLDDEVLDTYQPEREPHVRAVIAKGIELGRQQTVRDPAAAAARDRLLLSRRAEHRAPDTIRFPGLGTGLLAGTSGPGRGELAVQGVVVGPDGQVDRLDQVVGGGAHLLVDAAEPGALPDDGLRAALGDAGVTVVLLARPDDARPDDARPGSAVGDVVTVVDRDGTHLDWLAARGACAAAVRPDLYVFGTAPDAAAARDLGRELALALGAAPVPALAD